MTKRDSRSDFELFISKTSLAARSGAHENTTRANPQLLPRSHPPFSRAHGTPTLTSCKVCGERKLEWIWLVYEGAH